MPPYSSYFANGDIPEETTYDSFRHGIGLNVADMSEELAKARTKMNRASRAMKNMDNELEALQLSIGKKKKRTWDRDYSRIAGYIIWISRKLFL